ncbi:hypothetical protein AWB85_23220 [Mycobacteroides immunogenum]|uniref:Uncharacterized protein n=1 Tax=Mycobacteroides immunogenum TaxID=83262 RepID=A0A179VDF5_9MYCO|nr:hypothetical protein AWB85_23220 [Mycobacteroides immunogenum]
MGVGQGGGHCGEVGGVGGCGVLDSDNGSSEFRALGDLFGEGRSLRNARGSGLGEDVGPDEPDVFDPRERLGE